MVYIAAAKRTPIGSFGGSLSSLSAVQLGSIAVKEIIGTLSQDAVIETDEILMGCVLQANLGQAPTRQVAKFSGLPDSVCASAVNKVCASGMKAVSLGAQSIITGDNSIVIAGGMESMSQVPFYSATTRWGSKYGHQQLIDGLEKDGLTDVYGGYSMGICGELCAEKYGYSRQDQDEFAIESYKRSLAAWSSGMFAAETIPITISGKNGNTVITEDEEYKRVNFEKIPTLKPVFKKDGTITAANASTLSDGAAALILMNEEKLKKHNVKPLAIIRAWTDAEQSPESFTTTPAIATQKVLKKAGLNIEDIDFFEFNEAYAVVPLANADLLNISTDKININGGAVSLGHPLGCSGARIVTTLIYILKQHYARYGLAAICNGGGGASAMIIENIQ